MKKLITIISALLIIPSISLAQFTVPQGGTGTTTFPNGYVLTGSSSSLRITAVPASSLITGIPYSLPWFNASGNLVSTSSNPLWVTYVNATSTTATSTLPQLTAVDLSLTHALPATSGGTGINTYTTGDLIVSNAANSLAKLADVATGNALISGGVGATPSWGKIGLTTHVTGTLPIANGGTNNTSFINNTLTWFDGTSITSTSSVLTVNNLISTSTATSTFSGGIDAARVCIKGTTTCLMASSGGSTVTATVATTTSFSGSVFCSGAISIGANKTLQIWGGGGRSGASGGIGPLVLTARFTTDTSTTTIFSQGNSNSATVASWNEIHGLITSTSTSNTINVCIDTNSGTGVSFGGGASVMTTQF